MCELPRGRFDLPWLRRRTPESFEEHFLRARGVAEREVCVRQGRPTPPVGLLEEDRIETIHDLPAQSLSRSDVLIGRSPSRARFQLLACEHVEEMRHVDRVVAIVARSFD